MSFKFSQILLEIISPLQKKHLLVKSNILTFEGKKINLRSRKYIVKFEHHDLL